MEKQPYTFPARVQITSIILFFFAASYKPKPSYVQPTHPAPVQYVPSDPQDSYGSPAGKPLSGSSNGDSYGTPEPPYQPPTEPPTYQEEEEEEPFQTSYQPAVDPITNFHPTSTPLHGTFSNPQGSVVEEGSSHGHGPSEGHKKHHPEEYSSDQGHVDPILGNTLFYKDTKKIKFHQKVTNKQILPILP